MASFRRFRSGGRYRKRPVRAAGFRVAAQLGRRWRRWNQQTATSNYVGSNSSFNPGLQGGNANEAGLFIADQGRNFRDILDGTSNVVALGERRWQFKDQAGAIQITGAGLVFGTGRQADAAEHAGSVLEPIKNMLKMRINRHIIG